MSIRAGDADGSLAAELPGWDAYVLHTTILGTYQALGVIKDETLRAMTDARLQMFLDERGLRRTQGRWNLEASLAKMSLHDLELEQGGAGNRYRALAATPKIPEVELLFLKSANEMIAAELARRRPPDPTPPASSPPISITVTQSLAESSSEQLGSESGFASPSRVKGEVIAVFDLEDVGGGLRRGYADQLTEYFAVQLSSLGYKVVPRSQLRERISSEKQESYKTCYDESCQIDLGKAVAAQKSVATKLLKIESTCAITATVYDLRSETTETAASVETRCGQDELLSGLRELAKKLVSG